MPPINRTVPVRSGLNVSKRDWSDEILELTGLSRSHMPNLFEGSDATGVLTSESC